MGYKKSKMKIITLGGFILIDFLINDQQRLLIKSKHTCKDVNRYKKIQLI